MARFYIHLRNGDHVEPDADGEEFDDLQAARQEALQCAREILADAIRSAKTEVLVESFIIADLEGRELATILLKDALPRSLCE
jgi:hypothetical protein